MFASGERLSAPRDSDFFQETTMLALYNNVPLGDQISGYSVQVGLRAGAAGGGIHTNCSVSVLLEADTPHPFATPPFWNPALWPASGQAPVIQHDLKIQSSLRNAQLDYTFPSIELLSVRHAYDEAKQYVLYRFGYTAQNTMTPGAPATPPNVIPANQLSQELLPNQARAQGNLIFTGSPPAALLDFDVIQTPNGACAFQFLSERCQAGGWLQQILNQNTTRSNQGLDLDLTFQVNGQPYQCAPAPAGHGATFLQYEEHFGTALNLPVPDIARLQPLPGPEVRPVSLPELLASTAGRHPTFASVWRRAHGIQNQGQDGNPTAPMEVCTLVANSVAARRFDWRTRPQQPR
jgi:hypothetical protein